MTKLSLVSAALFATASLSACMMNGKPLFSIPNTSSPAAAASSPSAGESPAAEPAAPESPAIATTHTGEPPAWCKTFQPLVNINVKDLDSPEFFAGLGGAATVICDQIKATSEQHEHAEVVRQKWMAKFGMSEADFAREIGDDFGMDARDVTAALDISKVYSVTSEWPRKAPEPSDVLSTGDAATPYSLDYLEYLDGCLQLHNIEDVRAICAPDFAHLDRTRAFAAIGASDLRGRKKLHLRALYTSIKTAKLEPTTDAQILAIVQESLAQTAANASRREAAANLEAGQDVGGDCVAAAYPAFAKALASSMIPLKNMVDGRDLYPKLDPNAASADSDVAVTARILAHCDAYPNDSVKYFAGTLAGMHRLGSPDARLRGPRLQAYLAVAVTMTDPATAPDRPKYPTAPEYFEVPNMYKIASVKQAGDSLVVSYVHLANDYQTDCAETKNSNQYVVHPGGMIENTQICVREVKRAYDPTPNPVTIPKAYGAGIAPGRYLVAISDSAPPIVWVDKRTAPIAVAGVLLK